MGTDMKDEPLTRGSLVQLLRDELSSFGEVLRGEMRGEMAELRGELRGEMAELRGEMAELRAEMAELRAEMLSMQQQIVDVAGTVATIKTRWGGGMRPDGCMAALERIHRGIVECAEHDGPWGGEEDAEK